ncbi:MAG: GNAT family N-acetyltransferase [Inquilinus limosus]|uniref:GNAT family N-acetyltransferase n=1 Tax=Inquilinus limosus TaxID=171674 RepID=A0A952FPC7_9PROT|nr:GNAT family N-acetyltransferase [Inquilinus limosus]
MTGCRPVADLSRAERARVGALVAGHPVLALYWDSALDAAAAGDRSRSVRLEPDGAVLGIDFDGLTAYTAVGAVGDAALLALTDDPRPLELHLTPEQADRLRPACGDRLVLEDGLRFYARPLAELPEPDPACRRMGPAELEPLRRFYAAHYPTTVFSAWMLDLPFVAIVQDGRPVATGGVLARAGGRAMIGNFLVDPARRGEGLAGRVVTGLLAALRAEGVTMALLATNDLNPAACRVYERAGFALVERRVELDLRAA